MALALLVLLAAPAAHAQAVAVTPDERILVAHDGVIELFASDAKTRIWSAEGLGYPGAIAAAADEAAVADPLTGRVIIARLSDGRTRVVETHDTPIALLFAGPDLFILERDSGKVDRIDADGSRAALPVGAYPQQLRASADGRLWVYAAAAGRLEEISTAPFAVVRSRAVAPFASDLEVDRSFAYLLYPNEGKLRAFRRDTLEPAGERNAGGVDLAITSNPTALTAPLLAIADPRSKRISIIEGSQSTASAFGRGFLRGLLGIGLFGGRQAAFPAGVDRVVAVGGHAVAYDSSSGTLFSFNSREAEPIGKGIAPRAYAISGERAVFWNGTLVAQKLSR